MLSREDLRRWSGGDIFLVLVLGLVGGVVLGCSLMFAVQSRDPELDLRLISQAAGLVQRYYVDRDVIQSRTMTYGAISGMMNSLGDTGHSRFLSPQMVKEMDELERSKFQGIGAEVQLRGGHVVIVVPMDGSPAQRAGLKAGDIILKVDGQDISGWPLDKVVGQISGPAGTTVMLTVLTPLSDQTRQVTLTRATINIHNVSWQTLPGTKIVQLRIAALDSSVNADLRKALAEIMMEKPAAIVLDLRNNPGGLLDQAVDVASQFLNGGNVLVVKNARGQEKPVAARAGGEATKIPVVVLVNGGTASGAEIVAGALQDAHRARLVGDTTFGTGTVLKEFKLADGSALLLAIEEWLTPSGNIIWHKGITPNIAVSLSAGDLPLFPDAERTMTATQLQESHDAQLLRAMDLLTRGDVSPAVVADRASR